MHQAVLVHADVDESAEGGHIGHHAFEHHARTQVLEVFDAVLELRDLETAARIAARFVELGKDVFHGRQAETLVDELACLHAGQRRLVAHHFAQAFADARQDALHDRISLGVDGRGVERFFAADDAQEAGCLFKRLVAQARNFAQGGARTEGAMLFAMRDDVLGDAAIEAGHAGQQRRARGVHIDADRVHAIFDHGVELAREVALVHIMLVLADADRLGVDFHEFGQRVLQPARDRDRAAQTHIEVGEFLGCEFGGRIHRGARFADHDLGELQFGMARDEFFGQLGGLARGGAVADRNQIDLMLLGQRRQAHERGVPAPMRFMRIDRVGGEQLAGRIDDRDLHPGAQARVEAHGGAHAGGRSEQQILEVLTEDADRFVLGAFAQFGQQFGFERRLHFHAPGPAHDGGEPGIGRALRLAHADQRAQPRFARMRLALGHEFFGRIVERERDAEQAELAAAEDRERAVRRHGAPGLGVIEIIAELLRFGFLAFGELGSHHAFGAQFFAQVAEHLGVFGKFLGQDVARAVERGLGIGHLFIEEFGRLGLRIERRVVEQSARQGLEPGFARDLGAGAALGLVRQVKVFERLLGRGARDRRAEFGRQLALFGDAREDGAAAFFEFAQVDQTLGQVAQLRVVEAAGDFLAVTGDERHGRAFVEQLHRVADLLGAHREFLGNLGDNPPLDLVRMRLVRHSYSTPAAMKGAHSATAFRLFFLASLLGVGVQIHAEDVSITAPATALSTRFPPASIRSEAQAQAALSEVSEANARAEWAAYDQKVQCQSRFFVTGCVKDVESELRAAQAQIKRVEVEANRYLRRAKDAEHEQHRQAALKQAQEDDARLAQDRERTQADFERRRQEAAQREADAKTQEAQRAAQAAEAAARQQAKIQQAAQPSGLDAAPAARAENVRAYQDKQRAAQQRRAELAQRRAERAAREASAGNQPPAAAAAGTAAAGSTTGGAVNPPQ